MTWLILKLAPIALVDSTSIIPFCIVPLLLLLGGQKPWRGVGAFLSGIFLSYFLCGIFLLWGLDNLFTALEEPFKRWWMEPNNFELIFQVLIGIVILIFGYRMAVVRQKKINKAPAKSMSPNKAFLFGASFMAAGLWGALPYFAAIDQIIRQELSPFGSLAALFFYNIVFILPLFVLIGIWALFKEKSQKLFQSINRFLDHWLRKILIVALLVLGVLLIVDGITWLLGHPLYKIISGVSVNIIPK